MPFAGPRFARPAADRRDERMDRQTALRRAADGAAAAGIVGVLYLVDPASLPVIAPLAVFGYAVSWFTHRG